MKKSQSVMIWFLPVIIIGGLFFPILGYLVIAMMVFLLGLSFFKGRYWCWNLCPRGAFLDIVLSKFSRGKIIPKIFINQKFRCLVFVLFLSFLIFRIIQSGDNLITIGFIFVIMCLATTIIAIIIGSVTKHRAWCIICPMGTLQDKISKLSHPKKKE